MSVMEPGEMKIRRLFFYLAAGALLSLFSSVSLAVDDIQAGLHRCRAISDDAARLACFDALGVDSDDQSAASNVRPLDDSVGRAQLKSSDPDDAPVYAARLIRCDKSGASGRTVFYLDNDQVWLQSNTGGRRIRDCDADVEITKDLFGFILRIPSQNKARRVKRVR